jgi:hypothetical protein
MEYICPFCKKELKIKWQETTDSKGNREYDADCGTSGCFLEYGAGWYVSLDEIKKALEPVKNKLPDTIIIRKTPAVGPSWTGSSVERLED